MTWYKKAQVQRPDFKSVDVRRMYGIFNDFQSLSKMAQEEMDNWLMSGESDITIEEAKERLSYYLDRMGINE